MNVMIVKLVRVTGALHAYNHAYDIVICNPVLFVVILIIMKKRAKEISLFVSVDCYHV